MLTIHGGCPNASFDTTLELVCDDNGGPGQTSAASWTPFETPDEVHIRIAGALTDAGDYRLTLGEGGVVEGRVVSDVDGSPVPNVDLQLRAESTLNVWSASTNNAGLYRFADLPADVYRLVAFTNNAFLGEVYDDIPCSPFGDCPVNQGTPITVDLGQAVGIADIGLALGGSVTGRVVDRRTGEPIFLVEVVMRRLDDFGTVFTAFSRQDGTFRIEGLPAGTYSARTQIFGPYQDQAFDGVDCVDECPPPSSTPIVVEEGRNRGDINFGLARLATIQGTVEDTAGNPAPGQVVVAFDVDSTRASAVFSNADGAYAFGAIRPGRYRVTAGEIGLGLVPELFREVPCVESVFGDCDFGRAELVDVELEGTVSGVDFTLSPGATIAGRVTAAGDGAAISGARVVLGDGRGVFVAERSTDVDGRYRFGGLTGGAYRVEALATDDFYAVVYPDAVCLPECDLDRAEPVDVPFEGSRVDIDLALPRTASIAGRVTSAEDGAPVPNVTIRAANENGGRLGFTDSDGAYRVRGLFPGDYTLSVEGLEGFVPSSRQISVAASQQVAGEDFVLSRGAGVAGAVRLREGGPISGGSRIQIFDAALSLIAEQTLDGGRDLAYRIRGLVPGEYYVYFSPAFSPSARAVAQLWPGSNCVAGPVDQACLAAARRVTVASEDAAIDGIDFEIERFGEVLGTIRSAETDLAVDADIEMWTESGELAATSGSFDGVYAFQNPPPGRYFFVARPRAGALGSMDVVFGGGPCIDFGCDPTSGTAVEVAFNRTVSPSFRIPRGGSLSGRLRDRSGALLAGVSMLIELYDDADRLVARRTAF
ncbi:MAG: carboxypeptidase-like regulatory domain-containing protein, partial [Acidobacteriota bacterium]